MSAFCTQKNRPDMEEELSAPRSGRSSSTSPHPSSVTMGRSRLLPEPHFTLLKNGVNALQKCCDPL